MTNYPEMFKTGVVKCDGSLKGKKLLVSEALIAWGITHSVRPPENFGLAMAKISGFLGVPAGPDDLMALADELHARRWWHWFRFENSGGN
ncbi:MAG: hypothetical protein HRT93_03365 [Piscirickettsiaceae bacterium]|nr:hypothetical protein [Piscirickettsiaceae bacterium]